ncbi:hypothetical protein SPRG_07751 [Saprolegnia parasitica CBS 223.65]|uniref:Uncharacterized protein n=1 Tax=Saprolegnia parasitica (strain CBS 223.65) TaxID=695850 RepID=A0A067CCY1_SAPPC|nr:hypothetical protein SPRG_07751 [Saprolegnia parasitica CBS 223.65]KDO27040.1 hypothetical protein SPRG_07751 [Saprolegnia parasitica CBS 223.65]|eukprot:XP_012202135.1 hypothetical protein SPRG_07751 [Saprolegnia parasitica CBS 223.65]
MLRAPIQTTNSTTNTWLHRKLHAMSTVLAAALQPKPHALTHAKKLPYVAPGRFLGAAFDEFDLPSPDSAYTTDDEDDDDEILLWEAPRPSKREDKPVDYRWMYAAVENELSQSTRAVVYPEAFLERRASHVDEPTASNASVQSLVPSDGHALDDVQL